MSAKPNPYTCTLDVTLPALGQPLKIHSSIPLKSTATLTRPVKVPPGNWKTPKVVEILPGSIKEDKIDFFCIKIPTAGINENMPSEFNAFECNFDPSGASPQNPPATSSPSYVAANITREKTVRGGKSYTGDATTDTPSQDDKGRNPDDTTTQTDQTGGQTQTQTQTPSVTEPHIVKFSNDFFLIGKEVISKMGKINKLGFTNHTDVEQELTVIIGYVADD